jgi:hypothetical protein
MNDSLIRPITETASAGLSGADNLVREGLPLCGRFGEGWKMTVSEGSSSDLLFGDRL